MKVLGLLILVAAMLIPSASSRNEALVTGSMTNCGRADSFECVSSTGGSCASAAAFSPGYRNGVVGDGVQYCRDVGSNGSECLNSFIAAKADPSCDPKTGPAPIKPGPTGP